MDGVNSYSIPILLLLGTILFAALEIYAKPGDFSPLEQSTTRKTSWRRVLALLSAVLVLPIGLFVIVSGAFGMGSGPISDAIFYLPLSLLIAAIFGFRRPFTSWLVLLPFFLLGVISLGLYCDSQYWTLWSAARGSFSYSMLPIMCR